MVYNMVEPKKIFILEDEEILLEALTQKLRKDGFVVSGSRDGKEGLEKITEENPDLVLLDILLPSMNGFEVLENLRKNQLTRDIAVIIISNSGQPVEIERALKLGVKDYLVKAQFDPAEVIEKVRIAFGMAPEFAGAHWEKAAHRELSGIAWQESAAEPVHAAMPSEKEALRVLIVEDDKFLHQLLVKKFASNGFAVAEAIDGNEALAALQKRVPHVVLLDLILPGIDGFEVLRQMRQTPEFSKIPVIILSNLGQQEDIQKGQALGAIDYMVKANFTLDEIISRVRQVVQERYVDLR